MRSVTLPALVWQVACFSASCFGQVFTVVPSIPPEVAARPTFVRAPIGAIARIDWNALDEHLSAAAQVDGGEAGPAAQQPTIFLPLPTGSLTAYCIIESPIMEPGLAAKFPGFKTYRVLGIDDPTAVGRLDVTSQGFRGLIRTALGAIFIDPVSGGERDHVGVYYLHDFTGRDHFWTCGTGPEHGAGGPIHGDEPENAPPDEAPAGTPPTGLPLKAYRMAMACTGEYGAYQATVMGRSPNVTDAMAAIVSVVNRCNLTFEADLGVRFVLVANNDLVAYFDPATDPYANSDPTCVSDPAADCSGGYLPANIAALNTAIGSANFDIGHLLTRIRGGVAYLRSTCTNNKGGGISGVPRGGEVEPASALVPMHELGHQFGGNHTFNGTLGRCGGNGNNPTRWEPGGGSTLLAYAGACPVGGPVNEGDTDNLVQFADPYFHTGNLIEMRNFVNGSGGACSVAAATSNITAPTIMSTSPSGRVIPPHTPFRLAATVADDGVNLAYSWEQLDTGPAQRLVGPTSLDNGTSPLFRSFLPSAVPTRTFPREQDLLAGTTSLGEQLPSAAGSTRRFRFTVRDNQGRSTTSDIVQVGIGAGDPFTVTAPGPGATVQGPTFSVQWTIGSTNSAPISTTTCEIRLSLDGGLTFPHLLAASVPNSGAATVSATGLTSRTARIRVAANDNVYFNLSGTFDLRPACPADFTRDGLLSPDDLDGFITAFFSDAPGERGQCDQNVDGIIEPGDLDEFITTYFAGC